MSCDLSSIPGPAGQQGVIPAQQLPAHPLAPLGLLSLNYKTRTHTNRSPRIMMRIKLLSVHTLISPDTSVPCPPPAASLPQVSAAPTLSSHPYSTFCQLSALPAKHSQNPTRLSSHREPVKTSQVTPLLCSKPLKRGVAHGRLDLLPISLPSCLHLPSLQPHRPLSPFPQTQQPHAHLGASVLLSQSSRPHLC